MAEAAQQPIIFLAAVAKVQTLADGGIRIAFDISESEILSAAQLMECKRAGVALHIEARPAEINPDGRKPKRATREGPHLQAT